jgi:hypothetical protein
VRVRSYVLISQDKGTPQAGYVPSGLSSFGFCGNLEPNAMGMEVAADFARLHIGIGLCPLL